MSPTQDAKQFPRLSVIILGLILALAAVIRLARLDSVQPGFQVDEASNAWNAYSLLHTGRDEWGKPWPIFYARAFDDYRSPIYLYFLMPFQALGGMNVYTTRLPAAISGIVTVALIYFIGRRMFNPAVGLLAAAFLALAPSHVEYSQWGYEASLSPLLFSLSLLSLLWAGAPWVDAPEKPRWLRALVAGMIAGFCCYGYAALRLIIPVSFALAAAITWRHLLTQNRAWLLAVIGGFLIFFSPLVYVHLTDSNINTRGRTSILWAPSDPAITRIEMVLHRYVEHFEYEFLFANGGKDASYALPEGYGALNGYLLTALILGLVFGTAAAWRGSISLRVLLVVCAAYPVGDVLFRADGPNSLRCFPGVIPLTLLAAFGIVAAWRWQIARARTWAIVAAAGYSLVVAFAGVRFLSNYFTSFADDSRMLMTRHHDLTLACQWLAPRLEHTDLVFVTSYGTIFPYIQTLVNLQYDPGTWQFVQKQYKKGQPPFDQIDVCVAYDKFRFLHFPQDALAELQSRKATNRHDHVIMMLRPHERDLAGDHQPVGVIQFNDQVWLLLYDFNIE